MPKAEEPYRLPICGEDDATVRDLYMSLRYERDLIQEGGAPLLAVLKDPSNRRFLVTWCDCDAIANRWLVFPVEARDIYAYTNGDVSLRSLIDKVSDHLYIIDLDNEIVPIFGSRPRTIPPSYLPGHDSFYSEDLGCGCEQNRC